MISFKSALLFISGVAAGTALTASLVLPGVAALADSQVQARFRDVSASHAASKAVVQMAKAGIITGYPDKTYRGNQPVTRYELAVVLARFAKYYDTSKTPLSSVSAQIPLAPSWASPARTYLASNNFVPVTSELFASPGTASVSADLMSDVLSTTLDRLVDRSLPDSNQ